MTEREGRKGAGSFSAITLQKIRYDEGVKARGIRAESSANIPQTGNQCAISPLNRRKRLIG